MEACKLVFRFLASKLRGAFSKFNYSLAASKDQNSRINKPSKPRKTDSESGNEGVKEQMRLIPIVEILRVEENYEHGTFGILKLQKSAFCWTLEPRDEENVNSISSIPVQQYICKRINSPKYGITFEITNVPGRTNVLFHWGNYDNNTKGCVLVGDKKATLGYREALLNSKKTFELLIKELEGFDEFHLTIKESY